MAHIEIKLANGVVMNIEGTDELILNAIDRCLDQQAVGATAPAAQAPATAQPTFAAVIERAELSSVTDALLLACWWLNRTSGHETFRTRELTALCRTSKVSVGSNPTATLARLASKGWIRKDDAGWALTDVGWQYATELAERQPGRVLHLRDGTEPR